MIIPFLYYVIPLLGLFVLASSDFSEFHKNKFNIYFVLANHTKFVRIHVKSCKIKLRQNKAG